MIISISISVAVSDSFSDAACKTTLEECGGGHCRCVSGHIAGVRPGALQEDIRAHFIRVEDGTLGVVGAVTSTLGKGGLLPKFCLGQGRGAVQGKGHFCHDLALRLR